MSACEASDCKELVPWLLNALEEYSPDVAAGREAPIEWVDKDNGEFLIRWYRTSKKTVNDPNCRLFLRYTSRGQPDTTQQHTGVETKTDPNQASIGKRNLRSALHKSDLVEELTEKRQDASSGSSPWRVYRYLTEKGLKRSRPSPAQSPGRMHDIPDSTTRSPAPATLAGAGPGPILPDLPEFHADSPARSVKLSDGWEVVEVREVTSPQASSEYHVVIKKGGGVASPLSYTDTSPSAAADTPESSDVSSPIQQSQEISSSQDKEDDVAMETSDAPPESISYISQIEENPAAVSPDEKPAAENVDLALPKFWVVVRYCGVPVFSKPFFHPKCHVSYQKTQAFRLFLTEKPEKLTFGDDGIPQELLPDFHIPSGSKFRRENEKTTIENGRRILEEMYRGLEFEYDKGDIYVTRFCKCGVLYVSQATRGVQQKLDRVKKNVQPENVRTKIFDFNGHFNSTLLNYHVYQKGMEPHPFVYMSFGQKFCSNLHVDMVIASQDAIDQMQNYDSNANINMNDLSGCDLGTYTSVLKSKTDSFDHAASIVKGISEMVMEPSGAAAGGGNEEPMAMDLTT